MKLVVATDTSTLILWWRASLLASPTVVPASTVPCRWIVLVRARIASRSVVLPPWNGPTSAMHLGPLAPPLPAIALPPSAYRGIGPSSFQRNGGIGKRRAQMAASGPVPADAKKPPGRQPGGASLRRSADRSLR